MKTEMSDVLGFLCSSFESLSSRLTPLWHPLGFASCIIDQVPSSHVARVHYWPAGERRVKNPDWPIHTHTYALRSLVLEGEVRDLQYSVRPGDQWCVYSVNYYDGGSEIVRTSEEVDATTVIDKVRPTGSQYEVRRGIYHQTLVPHEDAAITLVLLTDHGSEAPKVLGSKSALTYPYDRISFDRSRFWGAVGEAVECHLGKR